MRSAPLLTSSTTAQATISTGRASFEEPGPTCCFGRDAPYALASGWSTVATRVSANPRPCAGPLTRHECGRGRRPSPSAYRPCAWAGLASSGWSDGSERVRIQPGIVPASQAGPVSVKATQTQESCSTAGWARPTCPAPRAHRGRHPLEHRHRLRFGSATSHWASSVGGALSAVSGRQVAAQAAGADPPVPRRQLSPAAVAGRARLVHRGPRPSASLQWVALEEHRRGRHPEPRLGACSRWPGR